MLDVLLLAALPQALPPAPQATLRLPAILGDHMVLQREDEARLWGWAAPDARVRVHVSWEEQERVATAGADGRWSLALPTPGAGGPHEIAIEAGERIVLRDVLVGEVWICGGQSNMEWPLGFVHPSNAPRPEYEAEIAAADLPRIRMFDVPNRVSPRPEEDCEGNWRVASPRAVLGFSMVGFFFGRALERELDVPIGLVGANWGGTVVEAWTSEEALARRGDFEDALRFVRTAREAPHELTEQHGLRRAAWWQALERVDPGGTEGGPREPGFDDSDWGRAEVPGALAGLDEHDGAAWLRRAIELPPDWAGRALALELGPIDDMDTVWWNGVRVGGLEDAHAWNVPRRYEVPADAATPGRNVIAIRVVDTGGPGGLIGDPEQLFVAPLGAGGERLSLAGEWRAGAGANLLALPRFPERAGIHANTPTALYNGMIAPIERYAVRGAIWYQGESNRLRAMQYRTLFPDMIADWRARFGRELPFYFVQIAPYAYDGDRGEAALLREAQLLALATPGTGMVVTMDAGDPADIHPRDKLTVGERLALQALAKTYGQDFDADGPQLERMEAHGPRARLSFRHAENGLAAAPGGLAGFTAAASDRRFLPARAWIEDDQVLVEHPEGEPIAAVRYCWGAADAGTLFDGSGLPAPSFRTDDWPLDD